MRRSVARILEPVGIVELRQAEEPGIIETTQEGPIFVWGEEIDEQNQDGKREENFFSHRGCVIPK
jgi:hypothetical protein